MIRVCRRHCDDGDANVNPLAKLETYDNCRNSRETNEHQRQRPDIYLGMKSEIHSGPWVGGNKNFELDHLLGPDAE